MTPGVRELYEHRAAEAWESRHGAAPVDRHEVRSALEDNGITLLVDQEAVISTPIGAVQIVGADWVGRAGVKEQHAWVRQSLKDFEERVDDLVAEGDRVVVRTTVSGVVANIADSATTRVSTIGVLIYRVSNGQIAEQWEIANVAGIMAQLGIALTHTAP